MSVAPRSTVSISAAQKGFRTVKDADITYHIKPGTNVFCLAGINSGANPKPAGVAALLQVEFTKGDALLFWTDEQRKVSDKLEGGWKELKFDDSKWVPAKVLGPIGMPPWGNVRTPESRLQAKRVRCWLDREDLKIGEAIRDHDKLLLVLSKNSIESDWVEAEVEAAFEREGKEKRMVLFPIRLDSEAMDIPNGWPAIIRRTRHIGNFTKWKTRGAYRKSSTGLFGI